MGITVVKPNLLLRLRVINYMLQVVEKWLESVEEIPAEPNRDELLALMELMNRITGLSIHGARLEKKVTGGREIEDEADGQTTPVGAIH